MTLSEYCRSVGISQNEMAARLFVHPTTVSRWATGALMPRRSMMQRIHDVTGGQVTPASFFVIAAPTPAASRSPARTTQRGPLAEVAVSPASASTPIASPRRIHEQDHDGEIGT